MIRRLVLLFLVADVLAFGGTNAQQPTKDPQAIAIIQAALTAMVGTSAIASITDVVATGQTKPTPNSWLKPSTFVWKMSGAEFRYENTRDTSLQILVSGHGKPAISRNGVVTSLSYNIVYSSQPFHVPALLLAAQVSNAAVSVSYLGVAQLNGKNAFRVEAKLNGEGDAVAQASQQVWYFDANTSLPVRVEYRLPSSLDLNAWVNAATEFSDFQNISGVMMPFALAYYEEGTELSMTTMNNIAFNVGLNPAEFDLSGG